MTESPLSANPPARGPKPGSGGNRWIRVVNALLSLAELAELEEATDRLVFGPLRDAEGKADLRAAKRRASGVGAEVGVDDGGAALDETQPGNVIRAVG